MSHLNTLTDTTRQQDELEQSLFAAELLQGELEYLRYQIKLLEDLAVEQSRELEICNQEIELQEKEILQLLAEKRLTLKEATEFANDLFAKRTPIRAALAQLLHAIYGETIAFEEFTETPELVDCGRSRDQSALLSTATKTFIV